MIVTSPTHVLVRAWRALGLAAMLALAACGGSSDSGEVAAPTEQQSTPQTVTLRVSVSGLLGSGLVLQNNAGDDLAIQADGSASFATALSSGAAFAVTVKTQPSAPAQTCSVSGGTGTATDGLNPVAVSCVLSPPFAYALSKGQLLGYSVDGATGALTPLPGFPKAIAADLGTVAIEPKGRFVYVAALKNGPAKVLAYAIDRASGALTPVGSPVPGGGPASPVHVEPGGRFAYIANPNDGTILAYAIDAATGALHPLANSPFDAGVGTALLDIEVDPGGKFVYARSGDQVQVLAIDPATGALAAPGTPGKLQANEVTSMVFLPSGALAITANYNDRSMSVFSVKVPTGELIPLGAPLLFGVSPELLVLHPSGNYLYIADKDGLDIQVFKMDPNDGVSDYVGSVPLAMRHAPYSMAVDPSGKFLYAVDDVGGSVKAWSIDAATGALTALPSSPFKVADQPLSLAITP